MRSFASVRQELLASLPEPRAELIPTAEAAGRVLLAPLVARLDDPAEPRSAMDGYAVAHTDLAGASPKSPVTLPAAGLLPAGRSGARRLPQRQALRIMTGAVVPANASAVVPVEKVAVQNGEVHFTYAPRPNSHIRQAGENFRRGDRLLPAHTLLRSQEVALCITAGIPKLPVARRVRVAVLSTGSELVPPARSLRRGEVFDSNRPMILAQVESTGAVALDLGTIDDRVHKLRDRLKVARREADFLITLGGVSAGDFDIVKLFLKSHKDVRLVQVAMRPARPQAFGRLGRLFWYALPGNPVSAWVAFDQLVRPLILRAQGHRNVVRTLRRGICTTRVNSVSGLLDFVRARADRHADSWQVRQVGPEGSSNLRSLTEANALLLIPESSERIEAGDPVDFELLSDLPETERGTA